MADTTNSNAEAVLTIKIIELNKKDIDTLLECMYFNIHKHRYAIMQKEE